MANVAVQPRVINVNPYRNTPLLVKTKISSRLEPVDVKSTTILFHNSTAQVSLPISQWCIEGFQAWHHLDPTPFIDFIPRGECLISPIIDVDCKVNWLMPRDSYTSPPCTLLIPHCLGSDIVDNLPTVQHGDLWASVPFKPLLHQEEWITSTSERKQTEVGYYEVDENFIIVKIHHFCQFICSTCKRPCNQQPIVFLTGNRNLGPGKDDCVEARLQPYVCSPLYQIFDYRKVCILLTLGLFKISFLYWLVL